MEDVARIKRIIDGNFYMHSRYGKHHTQNSYGLSRRDVAAKIVEQKGMCDDCGKDLDGCKWTVDHDHNTLAIRGVLCYACNTAIRGIDKMRQHIEYLRRHGVDI